MLKEPKRIITEEPRTPDYSDEIADFPFANKKTSTTGITNSAKNATDNGINKLLTSV